MPSRDPFGLLAPLRRDKKRDFASGGLRELVQQSVTQVLGTIAASDFTQGELPWRTDFGSLLFLLRHQRNDDVLRELARVYVTDALRRWEPRVEVIDVAASHLEDDEGNKLLIRLRYNVFPQVAGVGSPLLEDIDQELML